MSRPSGATIDLGALCHNYRLARRLHGGRALAVVKANAYGHGALACARALAPVADGFAVAFLEEAEALRAGGIDNPILVLEGAFEPADLRRAVALDCWLVVHDLAQIAMIEQTPLPPNALSVWLEIDSGMHRAGVAPAATRGAHRRLLASGKVAGVAFMTHFARADEPDSADTARQRDTFVRAVGALPGEWSLGNSAAILAWPACRADWARPGIMLYGAGPIAGENHDLRPVMRLESRVMSVRTIAPGEALGYGARFVAECPTRVGLVAIGYADGYPRAAPCGTPVAVDGRRTRLIGRVSMDMLTVDLSDLPQSGPDSRVELWGPQVAVNDVAAAAGTIAYEVLCNVKRVPLHHLQPALSLDTGHARGPRPAGAAPFFTASARVHAGPASPLPFAPHCVVRSLTGA